MKPYVTPQDMFSSMHLGQAPKSFLAVFVYVAVWVTLIGIALLFMMLLAFVLPIVIKGGLEDVFSSIWQPSQGYFGIFPMIGGSFFLAIFALLLGWFLALGLNIWILSLGKGYILRIVQFVVKFMTAIPTVVYGFTAVFLLVPLVRKGLGGTGFSWFSAGIILALLITPTMTLILGAGLRPCLEKMCPEGLAIGFSRLELLYFFVLPTAKKSLITASVIGFGRAIGDTLISLMLAGNAPQFPQNISESLRTLTAHIALVSANEVGGAAYDSLFLSGIILLCMNAVVSCSVRQIGKHS